MAGSNTDLTIRIRGRLDGAIRDLDRLDGKLSRVARSASRAERGWSRAAVSIRDFAHAGLVANAAFAGVQRVLSGVGGAGLPMERPRGRGAVRRDRIRYASRMSTTIPRNAMPTAHRIAVKMAPATKPSKQARTKSHVRLQKFGGLGSMHARVI